MLPQSQPPAVPAHLQRYVVEQDYGQYTEIDHAIWRFVLLQTYARLQHTAHPAYKTGLLATGIRVDRIPRIAEMNEKLARFGWGAICVDGFIPPRAFQGFMANGLLPIAAEIRTYEHLAYTPAPDIIHEAAGHAPILSEPAYAHFLRTIGEVSQKAFATPADRLVYDTIHTLSELKENPATTPAQLAAASLALERAAGAVTEISESARLARFYWWTAEYGLIGSVRDYRLYGAGLLSSLGESHSCHENAVRKIPLSRDCVDVDYDITRAQPQLFVARDFEQLLEVLDELAATLAHRVGGAHALQLARQSEELATLTLDNGLELVGIVAGADARFSAPGLVHLHGAPALARAGALLDGLRCPNDYVVALGTLRDGRPLSSLTNEDLQEHVRAGRLILQLSSGAIIRGLLRGVRRTEGRVDVVLLENFELQHPNGAVFRSQPLYPLALGGGIRSAAAGAPAAYLPASEPSWARVPRPRWFSAGERS